MLPVFQLEDEIVKKVVDNQFVIIVGETGSGKTTGLPAIFERCGLFDEGVIGVTEPRRIAATSTARFVAKQMGLKLGREIGYRIRHDHFSAPGAKIEFVTEGILLREMQSNPLLEGYSLIMLDEAHERSINIDLVMGLLKRIAPRRPDLRVVIASATIDENKFADYFQAPVTNIPGRVFPVEVVWQEREEYRREQIDVMRDLILQIHQSEPEGDILAFLPTVPDIKRLGGILESRASDLVVLPAYAELPQEQIDEIFEDYSGQRKVVLATNIAETSITIPSIAFIVDSGLINQRTQNSLTGISELQPVKHSQNGCEQRRGRAGRLQPGKAFRPYTKDDFAARLKFTPPEIQRTTLYSLTMNMEALEIEDIPGFDFMDRPDAESLTRARLMLVSLGAVYSDRPGLTELGEQIHKFPTEPHIADIMIKAGQVHCSLDAATICAFMSHEKSVLVRPQGQEFDADQAHLRFRDNYSDAITALKIWEAYEDNGEDGRWCFDNFINAGAMRIIADIREQFIEIMEKQKIVIEESPDLNLIDKIVASGLAFNLMERTGGNVFHLVSRTDIFSSIFIHPGSALFRAGDDVHFIVAKDIRATSRNFASFCLRVNPGWLPEVAPLHFCLDNEIILDSYDRDKDRVSAHQDIFRKAGDFRMIYGIRQRVGIKKISIDLDKAKEIQSGNIAAAVKSGFLPLQFEISRYGYARACLNGKTYEAYTRSIDSLEIKPGVTYYCEPLPVERFALSSAIQVRPKFACIDFDSV